MSKKTPLYNEHLTLGAKMVDFAGWEMPVQYTGVIEEHLAVRTKAGVFDVSHMGEVEVTGPEAGAFLQNLTANNVELLSDGHAQYSLLLNERGTVIDDIVVCRRSPTNFLIVVNASNREKDFAWIASHCPKGVTARDVSDTYALIALQGPVADAIFKKISPLPIDDIPSFHFRDGTIAGQNQCIASRTGYTGEPGCEIFCSPAAAPKVWEAIINEGKPFGLLPAGLGARDTLRLEMRYSLYGHEITDQTNALEAGLGWVVKLDKPNFIGKQALVTVKEKGLTRKLVGFEMIDRGIPRAEYPIMAEEKKIGFVTSGTHSPSLNKAIGLGYVPVAYANIGTEFSIDIRGSLRKSRVVTTPFYQPTART